MKLELRTSSRWLQDMATKNLSTKGPIDSVNLSSRLWSVMWALLNCLSTGSQCMRGRYYNCHYHYFLKVQLLITGRYFRKWWNLQSGDRGRPFSRQIQTENQTENGMGSTMSHLFCWSYTVCPVLGYKWHDGKFSVESSTEEFPIHVEISSKPPSHSLCQSMFLSVKRIFYVSCEVVRDLMRLVITIGQKKNKCRWRSQCTNWIALTWEVSMCSLRPSLNCGCARFSEPVGGRHM